MSANVTFIWLAKCVPSVSEMKVISGRSHLLLARIRGNMCNANIFSSSVLQIDGGVVVRIIITRVWHRAVYYKQLLFESYLIRVIRDNYLACSVGLSGS